MKRISRFCRGAFKHGRSLYLTKARSSREGASSSSSNRDKQQGRFKSSSRQGTDSEIQATTEVGMNLKEQPSARLFQQCLPMSSVIHQREELPIDNTGIDTR